ncbi:50S ribosomal protein L23 [bacterium]|mgnify:CR=1 FL=1|nr:50S ribosomal protein L23 [bacterium]|tara:strand:+ start:6363 stop:6662 length:300 start_codon:yes stop_codon:yes gene_type:complete
MSESFVNQNLASLIIKKPRITEKSTFLAEQNGYTFVVDARANKIQVKKAIEELYKVKPVKVNMLNVKGKNVVRRGKAGQTSGLKKAVVYLKKGDKIELV